jgi:zinc transport system ATP-binding protein
VTTPALRLVDARFGYRGADVVRADLRVDGGEVVAVVGPNGSGKSTLIKGTLRLVDHLGGTIEWLGEPTGTLRDRWRIGYVPQHELAASAVPATLEEVVRSGRVARNGIIGRYRAADRRAVADALDTVGLADRRRTPFRELSGGQQRRGLVARALAGDAEVLVLDEPFSGVDHQSQLTLTETFAQLVAGGATMLIVLHALGPLADLVTRVVTLEDGRVVSDEPPRADAHPELSDAHEGPTDRRGRGPWPQMVLPS